MRWKDVRLIRVQCRQCRQTLSRGHETLAEGFIAGIEHQVRVRHEQVAVTFEGLKDGILTKHTTSASTTQRRR